MYSTKTIHKNINPNYQQTYTSIGDPYNGNTDTVPSRWKSKQLSTTSFPKNAGNGFFQKLSYDSETYTETSEKYSKTQPERKLGFGSHDAFKSGEFTCYKTTERFRSLVKQENKLMELHRDEVREKELLEKIKDVSIEAPKDKEGKSLQLPTFLYDIGRSNVTRHNPFLARDCFYNLPKHAKIGDSGEDSIRRLGSHRTSSSVIGEYAWKHKYIKPQYGSANGVEKFEDRGHLQVKGF